MNQQRIDEVDWQTLVGRFSGEPGGVLFDVPDQKGQPARYQVFSAWPRYCWQAENGQRLGHTVQAINAHLTDTTDSEGPWLPLRAGFMAYGDGEMELTMPPPRPCQTPPLVVQEHDWLLLLDRNQEQITLHWQTHCPQSRRQAIEAKIRQTGTVTTTFHLSTPFSADTTGQQYLSALEQVDHYIHAGDVYQVNYAQRFHARYQGSPLSAFQALYQASPSPCSAFMDLGSHQILSLSPERFIRVQGQQVETRPIKGTRRRGSNVAEDQILISALVNSPKDRAENLMIVDLLRNDLGRCCEIGSITATPLFAVETYANVHHLVSTVQGRLRREFTPLDMLLSAFPGGSITGAPKRRAMEIIRELEPYPRGAYCGSFFHWTPANGLDSTIAIRTLECHDGVITCWGGGGIVADSVPEEEYQESLTKIRLFMAVLEGL